MDFLYSGTMETISYLGLPPRVNWCAVYIRSTIERFFLIFQAKLTHPTNVVSTSMYTLCTLLHACTYVCPVLLTYYDCVFSDEVYINICTYMCRHMYII